MINGLLISHKAIEVQREIDSLSKSELSLVSVFKMPEKQQKSNTFVKSNIQPKIKSFREKIQKSAKEKTGECSIIDNNKDNLFDIMEI
jgi:hypothetical protein